MFYQVGRAHGEIEVYGKREKNYQLIDPHEIFRTRTIGFDNIHRGIMGAAARKHTKHRFCRYLSLRFPNFDEFMVTANYYPDIIEDRMKFFQSVQYKCIARE